MYAIFTLNNVTHIPSPGDDDILQCSPFIMLYLSSIRDIMV